MTRSADAEVLLACLRVAVARLKLFQAEIEEVGVFLKAGRITPQGALHQLRETGVLDFCLTDVELVASDTGSAA